MEEENNKRETRRSRSKTPLTLRSSVDRDVEVDGEKKKVKKNPTVDTITEESPAPVVQQRTSTRTKRSTAKVSNDVAPAEPNAVNKETVALIANSVAVVPQAIAASEQTVTKTTTVITSKTVKTSSGEQVLNEKSHQSQTVTKSSAATRSREANQNESNLLLEQNAKLKTSTPRANKDASSNNSSFNNSSSITNGTNLEDHVAFKEYKEAGEYWNKFPKTDYTYSKLSQHRREIKPGVIAMPNMSRRSLEHHQTRVNDMIRRDPAQESFFRSRYEALTTLRKRRAADNYYDSQDETDISLGLNGGRSYTDSRSFFRRLITVITTFFSSTYYRVTSIFRREQPPSIYYARFAEPKKGIIRRSWESITNAFLAVFRYIYLGISTVLYLDSRALQSTSRGKKKGFLIGLLVLLPLLLFGAWNLSNESDRILYRKRFSNTLSELPSLPALPDTVHGTINEFASRTSKVIPIALALIRTQTSNVSDKLKFLFDFDLNWLPSLWYSRNQQQITNNIKASLSPEEYQNVLSHIDAYIETVINAKIQNLEQERLRREAVIDQKLAVQIAKIVKEQIITYKYTFTDADIERIAEVVRSKLSSELNKEPKVLPFVLSQENLEEISKVVKQNIEIHRHEWKVGSQTADSALIDIDEVLFKILSSSKLQDIIDKRVDGKLSPLTVQLSDHQISIDQLQNEINDLKEKFRTIFTANNDIQITVDHLKVQQNQLDDKIALTQKQTNEQLQRFLQEIDAKLDGLNEKQFTAIDNHIRIVLADILGYKSTDGKTLDNSDITNWIRSVFVAKELLEERLSALNAQFDHRINDEINQSAEVLIKNISNTIKHDITIAIEQKQKEIRETGYASGVHASLDETRIRAIIKEALAVYDADKTGMVDYALESAGGEVLSTRCTESFNVKSAEISIFGVPLWYKSNTPRTVISPTVQPGECWSFQGFPGYLVLKLNNNVYVTGFTMEHIPKSLAPNGRIDSAPKLFTVWGLETVNDGEPYQFGEYEYLENGTSLQYFPVRNLDAHTARSHNLVELRIESNHGNTNYTCLYRFRVHGTLTPSLS